LPPDGWIAFPKLWTTKSTLSLEEHHAVAPIAWSLPTPAHSIAFMRAVERVLGAHPTRGEGLAHRVACDLLPHFFVPPAIPRLAGEHINARRPYLRRQRAARA
jgi:hypothetical protein